MVIPDLGSKNCIRFRIRLIIAEINAYYEAGSEMLFMLTLILNIIP